MKCMLIIFSSALISFASWAGDADDASRRESERTKVSKSLSRVETKSEAQEADSSRKQKRKDRKADLVNMLISREDR